MFNLGPLEIIVVFGIALVVLGPRKLPEMARHLGKAYSMIRRTAWDLRQTLDTELLEEDRTERRSQAELRREEFRRKREEKLAAEGAVPEPSDRPAPTVDASVESPTPAATPADSTPAEPSEPTA